MGVSRPNDHDAGGVIEEIVPVGEEETIYVAHHDVEENGLTVTLSLALAEVTDLDPTDIVPKFAKHVDPDALDRMFRPRPNGDLREGGPFHLTVAGHPITVHNTGRIEIRG
jgi:hypothetical protein